MPKMTYWDTENDRFRVAHVFSGMIMEKKDPKKGDDNMDEKRNVILWTTLAAGTFCLELVMVTLTPFAATGTRFGSYGMFYNLLWCGGSYIIPLILYCQEIRLMKYVIGCVNGFWLICHPAIAVLCFGGAAMGYSGICKAASGVPETASLMTAGVLSATAFVTGILWYPMCRKKKA